MRLDKFISQNSRFSRKEIKKAIRDSAVTIAGKVCTDAGYHLQTGAEVHLDGERIDWPTSLYFMLNKPAGYCCSHIDDGYPSLFRLLDTDREKLHIAGRLDADTTGLVLLSSDGQWSHRVTSPKQKAGKCSDKIYHVVLAKPLTEDAITQLEQGILLRSETKPTRPARLKRLSDTVCELAIQEGKYHQVKRMFAAVGNQVTALHRLQIAGIRLDPTLKEGEYRPLTQPEIDQFC